ncbi:hypothetical protein ABVK25_012004 [Lepraria finkii]|uniref:Uncharacterized protein n=1 Tax=Lepraria finkii TaxID=1340010 RepID=A0ABR4AJA3_9LECA
MSSQGGTGALALSGEYEFIKVKLLEEVDHDRKSTGEGKSIMCYDPKVNMESSPLFDKKKLKAVLFLQDTKFV